ncbi:MAG: hypothetical protein GXO19_06705 [Epsilonproteobacteria bacterium]|nr:hypothetical protein [Campylobacterota bacterium]NPA57405.1 hypothetical protein [Campylobacterota bacterium]
MDPRRVVICPICQTPHLREPLERGEEAHCSRCGATLYRERGALEQWVFIAGVVGLILFGVTLLFPLITILLGGNRSEITLVEGIFSLYEQGFLLVALLALMVLIIYPSLLLATAFLYALALLLGGKRVSRWALVLFTLSYRWSMVDIFLVAVLVAMIKIFEYASIHFGMAFWALLGVVATQIFLVYGVGVEAMWDRWEELYYDKVD